MELRVASRPKEHAEDSLSSVLSLFHSLKQAPKTSRYVSSVFLQIAQYGKAFKRVIEEVEVDTSNLNKLLDKLFSSSTSMRLSKTIYKHKWRGISASITKEAVESILEPLAKTGVGDFSFKTELRYNEKFEEAFRSYVYENRVTGKLHVDDRRLIVLSRVASKTYMGEYYTIYVVDIEPDTTRLSFLCTCPWARGETSDSSGRQIPAEYTSMCKHGIATLFFYFPEIMAFLIASKGGRVVKSIYGEKVAEIRSAFKKVVENLQKYMENDDTNSRVIISNVVYVLVREIYRRVYENGYAVKYVPSIDALPVAKEVWEKGIVVKRVARRVEGAQPKQETINVEYVIEAARRAGLYERLKMLEELLNGLQGSRSSTLYTRALLAGVVIGSDLESDPVIVSVVGDPGTGKTLSAEGLSKLIGIRSIVVEREVDVSSVRGEFERRAASQASRLLEFFARAIEPAIPEEKRQAARKFYEELLNKTPLVSARARALARLAKKLALLFSDLYGVRGKTTRSRLARLFYETLKIQREVFASTVKNLVERKALEARRELLAVAAQLNLVSRPEDKEEHNSGAVRWEIEEVPTGYRIRLVIDLHYLLRRFNGDPTLVREVVNKLSRYGRVYVRTEIPGAAELKLSEAEYLEKAMRVREEDILSPARRLIWVGGEVTKRAVILIDESRRAPELLERLLTDLSSAPGDMRRSNLIVTTDNAEPLMEAESDPRLDAFHSRVNMEVVTPSTTVASIIRETLAKINELRNKKALPIITLDEALFINFVASGVEVPERFEVLSYSIPLLLTYDFWVAQQMPPSTSLEEPPILIRPKGSIEDTPPGYTEVSLGENVATIRMMPERRLGHHVVRLSKVLAALSGKSVVDLETFLSALRMVLMARVIPASVQSPYLYIDAKMRVVDAIVARVKELLSKETTATEEFIEALASMRNPSPETVEKALVEMSTNPVAIAVFIRFLAQVLVSEQARAFREFAAKTPWLKSLLDTIARYEKIYM